MGRAFGGASRAPHALLVGRIRRWTGLSILLFLVLLLSGVRSATNPERLSRLSEVLLSRVLGGNVRVRTARLSLSGTLLLSGVEVRPDDSESTATSDIPIFAAEQIEARFDWFSLLSGQLSATQLVATTPVFRAIEERDTGHWNYERLRPRVSGPKPRSGGKPGLTLPVVILRDAHVKWGQAQQGRVEQTAETVIDGEMIPDPVLTSTYHFQFSQLAPGNNAQTPLAIGATLHGTWNSATNVFSLNTENVVMSDVLRSGLPRQAREWCEEHHLAGRLSQLNMSFDPQDGLVLSVAFDNVSLMWMIAPQPGIAVGEERPAYPLDVRNVRGQVVFALQKPAMRIINLTGEVLGYRFVADCDVKGATSDAPFALRLRFPQANLTDRYPPLFMAFLTSQDLLQRVEPHGVMDIALDMRRSTADGPLTFNGTIDCHDARMRYAHFPFPLDHVNGRITFDQQSVTFHDLVAKADLNDVLIHGSCGTIATNRFVDIIVSSQNTYFDDRLAACLPRQFFDIWNAFAVRGHGGFVCTVLRDNGPNDPQTITVDLTLDDASGFIRSVPYPFTHATGKLHLEADQTRIESFTARTGADGSGIVTLDGIVRHNGADVSRLLPELHVVGDVPIDTLFLHALPEELYAQLHDTRVDGRLAFDGTVRRKLEPDAEPTLQLAAILNWKQGTLRMSVGEQALTLSDIAAHAVLSPTDVELRSFNGKLVLDAQDPLRFALTASGRLALPSVTGELQTTVSGKGIALPVTAPESFPKALADAWREFAPTGKINLDAAAGIRVNMPADSTAVPQPLRLSDSLAIGAYRAGITLHDAQLASASWPAPLNKLQGAVEIVPGRVSMSGMSGAMGGVALAWQGHVIPETGQVALSGSAQSAGWPAQLMSYLPEGITSRLDLKQEGTTLALRLDSLNREAKGLPWSFDGKLQAANLATIGSLSTRTQQVELAGKGIYTPAMPPPSSSPVVSGGNAEKGHEPAFDLAGILSATNLTVSDHVIETLKANVKATTADHTITISDIDGRVAQGALQGKLLIHTTDVPTATQMATTIPAMTRPGPQNGYQADLVLHNAELSSLLVPGKVSDEERKKVSSGRVTASLSLQETFGIHPDRTGRGELIVQDGNMYNAPLAMGLMQIVTLRLPVSSSFQQAAMSYYLRNDEVTFDKILLESAGINVAGLGTVSLADRSLNMSFVTASPHELYIPFISDVIRETRNELLQLSVTGPLDKPTVTPVPLSAISNVLRLLLPPPRTQPPHTP
jgi:hypothetical protein